MENALRDSEEKYKMLFESDPAYTILLDIEGKILEINNAAVNFYANTNYNYVPLVQSLTASLTNPTRVNPLENFFILSRNNQTWTGTGYAVSTNSSGYINSLYRFSASMNVAAGSPFVLFSNFFTAVINGNFSGMSHILDGVETLRVRAYDQNGNWMTSTLNFSGGQTTTNKNVYFYPAAYGETGFLMFSNTLPASVEVEMDTLEDRVLQRASVWPNGSANQVNYLEQQAGNLHVFRQRVSIPNANAASDQ